MAKTSGMAQQSYPKSWRTLKKQFCVYTCIWANCNDFTVLPKPGIMVNKGNHPKMAQHVRIVKYYNSPRCIIRNFRSLPKWLICLLMVWFHCYTNEPWPVFQISFHQRFFKPTLWSVKTRWIPKSNFSTRCLMVQYFLAIHFLVWHHEIHGYPAW